MLFTAFRLATQKEHQVHPERNPVIRLFRRYIPVTRDYRGDRFFSRLDGRLMATPLFLVVLMIEATDVVFAIDSIPAIFAVTRDPFIVYTSNAFAISTAADSLTLSAPAFLQILCIATKDKPFSDTVTLPHHT